MSGLSGFFGKVWKYLGFGTEEDKVTLPDTKTKPKRKSPAKKKVATKKTKTSTTKKKTAKKTPTKTADEKSLDKAKKQAEKAVKAIEIAKELQTDKGKARYMSRLRNALKKAIVEEAVEEIEKAETKVKNYLAKQEQK